MQFAAEQRRQSAARSTQILQSRKGTIPLLRKHKHTHRRPIKPQAMYHTPAKDTAHTQLYTYTYASVCASLMAQAGIKAQKYGLCKSLNSSSGRVQTCCKAAKAGVHNCSMQASSQEATRELVELAMHALLCMVTNSPINEQPPHRAHRIHRVVRMTHNTMACRGAPAQRQCTALTLAAVLLLAAKKDNNGCCNSCCCAAVTQQHLFVTS